MFPFSLQLNNWFIFCFDFSVPSFTFTPTGIYLHLPSSSSLSVWHVLYCCVSVFISFSEVGWGEGLKTECNTSFTHVRRACEVEMVGDAFPRHVIQLCIHDPTLPPGLARTCLVR